MLAAITQRIPELDCHMPSRIVQICGCFLLTSIFCVVFWPVYKKTPAELVETDIIQLGSSALLCCGGNGVCLQGSVNSYCCTTEAPLLCGARSLGFVNSLGDPYCCGPQSMGCFDICINQDLEDASPPSGRCNAVAPQGVRFSDKFIDSVLPLNGSWDPTTRTYEFDGNTIASTIMPIKLGTGPFTIDVTITPTYDNLFFVPFQGRGCVLSKFSPRSAKGFNICIFDLSGGPSNASLSNRSRRLQDPGIIGQAIRFIYTDGFSTISTSVVNIFDLPSGFTADVPIRFTIVKNESHHATFVNARRIFETELTPDTRGIEVDNDAPLVVGGALDDNSNPVDLSILRVSNLWFATYAYYPDA